MRYRDRFLVALGVLALVGSQRSLSGNPLPEIRTVFIIMMENHNWSSIQGSSYAPYINNTLLPMSSYCQQYYNPTGIHPSEPNYLWLEAGTNFGIFNDDPPSSNQQNTINHLVSLLQQAGISWKTYQENISGMSPPVTDNYPYMVKHNPFMFFQDVTSDLTYCNNHVRPYPELAVDLANNAVARYNFITPNITNDMHDAGCTGCNSVANGDGWLSREVPKILASAAWSNNGAIFITWDEGSGSDGPIGMIVLSPLAKGGGYSNTSYYNHSSTLRTMQTIFGVQPFLGAAANATDLSDLFLDLSFSRAQFASTGVFQLTISGTVPGRTNVVESSSDLFTWNSLVTNVPNNTTFTVVDPSATNANSRFYRVRLVP